ncbi:hypothetical protein HUSEC_26331, partial [Escherichia coli O104:H4 str. LB226692]
MITVLAVNPACTGFIVLLKVHAIKLLVSLMMRDQPSTPTTGTMP